MIEARQLDKSFDKLQVLDGLDLNVGKSSIYGLVGVNGAGKTTLLKTLAGIYRQDAGTVKVKGVPVYENDKIKEEIIFIPDDLFVFSQYTIREMASFYRQTYPNWDEERFDSLGNIFGLDIKRRVSKLSKGMKRQVAFWMGLSTRPQVLILDEPLDGLDPIVRNKVKKLLMMDVADREMSVVISSHNLRELEDICDHVGIMNNGKIIIERELDSLKSGTCKVQAVFQGELPEALVKSESLLYWEKRGSVYLLIMRGEEEKIKEQINAFSPLVIDLLPLTFEEIFVYEMGGVGYDISSIL